MDRERALQGIVIGCFVLCGLCGVLKADDYATSDLEGVWRLHSLWAGPRTPFWDRGSVTVTGDGTFTYVIDQYDGGVENGGGQFQIDADGSVSVVGESHPWHMSMGKGVMPVVETVNDAGNDNGVIRLLTKQAGGYALSDLAGTWRLHCLWAGPRSPFWDRGSITVASNGAFTFTIDQYDGSVENGTGQFQIGSDGSVTIVGESDPWHMSADKSVMAMVDTVTDNQIDNGVIRVLTKQGSGYTLSDLVGTWRLHSLWMGPRTPFWDRGTITVAEDGTFTFVIDQYDGSVENGGGQFQIASDGSVTVVGESDPWHMSADKSVMVMVDTVTDMGNDNGVIRVLTKGSDVPPQALLHDWNDDGIVSIVGDVPPFVNCVYFQDCPTGMDTVAVGDCNGDDLLSIVGDVPCFVDCVYFGDCPD